MVALSSLWLLPILEHESPAARGAGMPYLEIFRFAGTVGFLPYGFRGVTESI